MTLDKSSCALLRYLLQLDAPETIMSMSQSLNQSRRKIYYHLEKINQSLPETVPKLEAIPRVGVILTPEQKEACQVLLSQIDSYSYILNMTERIQLITLYIAMIKQRITIEQLMELTEVSRNTVLNDLNDIRQKLASDKFGLTLHSTKAEGYFFNGYTLNKLQYFHALLYEMMSEGNESFLQIVKTKLNQQLSNEMLISVDFRDFLQKFVRELGEQYGKRIQQHEILFMLDILPYMLLSYRNMKLQTDDKRELKREFGLIHRRMEYQWVLELNQKLNAKFHMTLDDAELSIIALLLLSYRKDKDIHTNSTDFEDLRNTLTEFIDLFEERSDFIIEQKDDLLRNLLMHSKALLFRKAYGLLSKNPLTSQIMQKYPDLFLLTKESAKYLEKAWNISLSDDNIAYLTIHMGGAIKRSRELGKHLRKTYIICDEGASVQKLLLKQCQSYLPNVKIEAIFTTEQFKSVEDLIDESVLISTNKNLKAKQSIIYINPILTLEDGIRLSQFASYGSLDSKTEAFSKHLEKILHQHLGDTETTKELQVALQQLIHREILISDSLGETSRF